MERKGQATITTVMRKSKWQYPQVGLQTPRILQLPRRHSVRRNATKGKTTVSSSSCSSSQKDQRVRLEVLFHQERQFDRGGSLVDDGAEEEGRRRGKVADGREIGELLVGDVEEATWRFQAEMLRSECNLLRIEKEIAVKKMERRKKRMERTLKSAVHTLISGKQRISEGESESKVLEDEISYLVDKLNELKSPKVKDMEAGNFRHNFDRQASVLRRELEKFDETSEVSVKGIQKMAEASFFVPPNSLPDQRNSNGNIDTLSSKMEALSKGVLLERMEREYGASLVDLQDAPAQDKYSKVKRAHEEKKDCSRHCKAVMRKIAEEVRGEAEQWSQMQEMLGQVRKEMEELQACRDFWQNRAIDSDSQIQNLQSSVEKWRRKASTSDAKLRKLEAEVCRLQEEINKLKKEPEKNSLLPSESEKRVLICRLKENHHSNNGDWSKHRETLRTKQQTGNCSRPPLKELRNSSSVTGKQRNFNVPFT